MKQSVVSLLIAFAVVLGNPAPTRVAAGSAPYVSASMPIYESPGGLVPVIITLWQRPAGYAVALDAEGTNGAVVTCVGSNWVNPIRGSHSRACYIQLPLQAGEYNVAVTATLTASGKPNVVVEGHGARPIKANGYASPIAMTIARAQQVERCGNQTDRVWLTFDDSIGPERLTVVLQTLATNGVRARFFLTGRYKEKHPRSLRRIRRQGHLLGNHTYSHVALSKTADDGVLSQIDRGIGATTTPKLLRPPYGAGSFTTRLEQLAAQRSYELCRWTNDPHDWQASASAEILVERVRYGDYRSPPIQAGGVILLHGHGEHTLEALQGIIDAVRAKGLTLERLP